MCSLTSRNLLIITDGFTLVCHEQNSFMKLSSDGVVLILLDVPEEHYGSTPYGTLSVETRGTGQPLLKEFIEAGKQLGYPYVDLNGPQRSGVAIMYQFH